MSRNQDPVTRSSAATTAPATHLRVVVMSALLPFVAVRQQVGGQGRRGRELDDGLRPGLLPLGDAEGRVVQAGAGRQRLQPRGEVTLAAGAALDLRPADASPGRRG